MLKMTLNMMVKLTLELDVKYEKPFNAQKML